MNDSSTFPLKEIKPEIARLKKLQTSSPDAKIKTACITAISNLEKLKLDPKNVTHIKNLGLAYGELSDLARKIPCFQIVVAINTTAFTSWNVLIESLFNANRENEALQTIERLLQINGTQSAAWSNAARWYSKQGNTESALRCSRKALELDPKNTVARKIHDEIVNPNARPAPAPKQPVVRVIDASAHQPAPKVTFAPTQTPDANTAAQINAMMGQIVRQQPAAPAPSAPPKLHLDIDDFIRDAESRTAQQNFHAALDILNRGLRTLSRSDHGRLLVARALAYAGLGNAQLCFADFEAAKPYHETAYPAAQVNYWEQRANADRIFGNIAEAPFHQGKAHKIAGNPKEAKISFAEAEKICDSRIKDKKLVIHLRLMALILRSDIQHERNNDKEALKDLLEATHKIFEENKHSRGYLAWQDVEKRSKARKANMSQLFAELRKVVREELSPPVPAQPVAVVVPSVSPINSGPRPTQAPRTPPDVGSSDESNSPPRPAVISQGSEIRYQGASAPATAWPKAPANGSQAANVQVQGIWNSQAAQESTEAFDARMRNIMSLPVSDEEKRRLFEEEIRTLEEAKNSMTKDIVREFNQGVDNMRHGLQQEILELEARKQALLNGQPATSRQTSYCK